MKYQAVYPLLLPEVEKLPLNFQTSFLLRVRFLQVGLSSADRLPRLPSFSCTCSGRGHTSFSCEPSARCLRSGCRNRRPRQVLHSTWEPDHILKTCRGPTSLPRPIEKLFSALVRLFRRCRRSQVCRTRTCLRIFPASAFLLRPRRPPLLPRFRVCRRAHKRDPVSGCMPACTYEVKLFIKHCYCKHLCSVFA